MIDILMSQFEGAFAENTLRAYRADFKVFSAWCNAHEIDPLNASPGDLAAFVELEAEQRSTATIRRRVASISSLLKLNNYPDPTRTPEVILALKRIHRQKGRAQKQAYPLTKDILNKLLAVTTDDLIGARDRVMLLLGYNTMRRRSELCNFRFEDIESLPLGRTAIRLRFSKTDQFGEGKLLPTSPEVIAAITHWQQTSGVETGYILREVTKTGNVKQHMRPGSISVRLKALQLNAHLDLPEALSGHSFRVGAAIDLLEAGESLEKIMLRGGWQSDATTIRYLRRWNAL